MKTNVNRSLPAIPAASGKVFATVLALAWTCVLHAEKHERIPGRLLIKPRDGFNESDLRRMFARHGAHERSAIHQINVRILNVPESAANHVREALQNNPNIEFVEPDYLVEPVAVPNDRYYGEEWHLSKIAAPPAWNITPGSSSVIIAILDSGVDGAHPDLSPQLVAGWNFFDDNSDTRDVYGHGTLVAGAAGAASNNGTGVTSVAWGCRIMPIRVSDTNGYGSVSAISQGLAWAADQGVRLANLSFANVTKISSIDSAAQYFQSKGGVVIAAAGNNATFDSTPDNPNFLMVNATEATDELAVFSNTGNNIDLTAPGVGIVTTAIDDGYAWCDGTSLSAPIVAGVAALVLSANPNLSGVQVQNILEQTADDLGTAGWDSTFGYGCVNAYEAVLAGAGATQPLSDATANSTPSTGVAFH